MKTNTIFFWFPLILQSYRYYFTSIAAELAALLWLPMLFIRPSNFSDLEQQFMTLLTTCCLSWTSTGQFYSMLYQIGKFGSVGLHLSSCVWDGLSQEETGGTFLSSLCSPCTCLTCTFPEHTESCSLAETSYTWKPVFQKRERRQLF